MKKYNRLEHTCMMGTNYPPEMQIGIISKNNKQGALEKSLVRSRITMNKAKQSCMMPFDREADQAVVTYHLL